MTNPVRLGAIFWLLTLEFFIAQFIAQTAWPVYSLLLEDISNLGVTSCDRLNPVSGVVTCSPLNLVFNLGIGINGVLTIAGAWLTRSFWPRGWRTTLGLLVIIVASGAGCILVGLFPVDVNEPMHVVGALLALLVGNAGFVLLGSAVWQSHRQFALYSIGTGIFCSLGFVLFALTVGHQITFPRGLAERLAAWPQTLWYMVTGALILSERLKATTLRSSPS